MASGHLNNFVEDALSDSVLKADRKAFYYGETNIADFENNSSCSTTAQNSSEISLETTNSTTKVTTSAAVVSEDEFEGNYCDTLTKTSDRSYTKNEFNYPQNLQEESSDFDPGNNKTTNDNKNTVLNVSKNTRLTHKSKNELDTSTTVEKPLSECDKNMTKDVTFKNESESKVSENNVKKGNNDKKNSFTSKTMGKTSTNKVVSEVYFFLLQMKLLNTLDLVRSVCKPWGVPPFGNDYVFHFDQIANTNTLGLLQRYEDTFAPIYSKFSSGNPKLLWTKVEDVDYFKIVYQLECIRFKQPFISSIYENILRYTITKLESNGSTNVLDSLNNSYVNLEKDKENVCSYCGNVYRGKECKYCLDYLDNTPTKRAIIGQINVPEPWEYSKEYLRGSEKWKSKKENEENIKEVIDLEADEEEEGKDNVKDVKKMKESEEVVEINEDEEEQEKEVEREKEKYSVDEWPNDLKKYEKGESFTLTSMTVQGGEDESYNIFNEDISNSFMYSAKSVVNTVNKTSEQTNKEKEELKSNENTKEGTQLGVNTIEMDKTEETNTTGLMEEVDLTTNNSLTSSNNNTRIITTDNVDSTEVDVTTNSNVDFNDNFNDNTTNNTENSISEKGKSEDNIEEQETGYGILDENILSTINEELLNISDEDILEEQYLNKGNQDIEKIILSVLNRKLNAHFNKFQNSRYNQYLENNGYLMSLYGNYPYQSGTKSSSQNIYGHNKGSGGKYKSSYMNNYGEDSYRNMDKYAYIENKYAHMENKYNYIDYPMNQQTNREKKRLKSQKDPDYHYPYSSYKEGYKMYNKEKNKERLKDKEEKKRKRRVLSEQSGSNNEGNQENNYNYKENFGFGTGFKESYGSYKDRDYRDKEIKISSHVVSASVSYDKRQQRFMAQWKTKEGTKHSKSFYAKRYATPIMARKHAELYKMYILQHRVMNSNELVEPTYDQLLANNFKDLDAVNVGELDYDI